MHYLRLARIIVVCAVLVCREGTFFIWKAILWCSPHGINVGTAIYWPTIIWWYYCNKSSIVTLIHSIPLIFTTAQNAKLWFLLKHFPFFTTVLKAIRKSYYLYLFQVHFDISSPRSFGAGLPYLLLGLIHLNINKLTSSCLFLT